MKARFCFRFDIDSHVCMDIGVPRLAELADELDVRFTFFALMGRAAVRHRRSRSRATDRRDVTTLSAPARFGLRRTAEIALLNPLVGSRRGKLLGDLAEQGHEIGLHGGHNHRLWVDDSPRWTPEKLRGEIAWGTEQLRAAGVEPYGFASPGAVSPRSLPVALEELGYTYFSDRLAENEVGLTRSKGGLISVPVSILGDPGAVGYLEWARARGLNDLDLETDFTRRLDVGGDAVVAYDHPGWAGVRDLTRVRVLVELARDKGFEIATIRQMVESA